MIEDLDPHNACDYTIDVDKVSFKVEGNVWQFTPFNNPVMNLLMARYNLHVNCHYNVNTDMTTFVLSGFGEELEYNIPQDFVFNNFYIPNGDVLCDDASVYDDNPDRVLRRIETLDQIIRDCNREIDS
jgi:hypothetical protein